MDVELEPRVKPLAYKVKAMSRESPAQKAAHVLDTDLRNHWSTGTNTKEWILLELDEPCLLSHLRIYNKSVLEWEISAGLRYKPEAFIKVRSRCEAPRRDMMYQMNYSPCRYVRISCMRGNPIAIFFIQLIGVSVPGLEPEFQPVANYLLPYIILQKQEADDMHLKLLQDVTSRLATFLPHLEADLTSFSEDAEPTMRFLAMLVGPFYPILKIVSERESARLAFYVSEQEASKTNLSSTALTVSSNFEPRRSRNPSSIFPPVSTHSVYRPDAVFALLRKAYKDTNLGIVCKMASRILTKLMVPITNQEISTQTSDISPSVADDTPKSDHCDPTVLADYSNLFGEEFQLPDDFWDPAYLNVLDSVAVEEGIMHVLYASASQPLYCNKLAEHNGEFWFALPLIQALLPALRPVVSNPYQIADNISLWNQPYVQKALSQIVAASSSAIYYPLLRACAGYLASFSPSHAKAACILIDLCSGVLAPWIAQVIAKVDLTLELLEDLLGVIQGARFSFSRACAALKYIVLALSGSMDDIMGKYKEAKHRILFLLEMLDPFLGPFLIPSRGMIPFRNAYSNCTGNREQSCALVLNIIQAGIRKSYVLTSLEAEWRRGSVTPSVLLQVLDAQLQLPPDIDNCKFSLFENVEQQASAELSHSSHNGMASFRSYNQESADTKVYVTEINGKVDVSEDASLLFSPPELNQMSLIHVYDTKVPELTHPNTSLENKNVNQPKIVNQTHVDVDLEAGEGIELYNILADYSQLLNYRDCEMRASEFRRLALDLNSQEEVSQESRDVAIDALLLAAECYVNPSFMMSFKDISSEMSKIYLKYSNKNNGPAEISRILRQKDNDLKLVADIERKRDRVVLEILIEAAEVDRKYHKVALDEAISGLYADGEEEVISLSQQDIVSADAITLVRQNQALLCNFVIKRLWRDSHIEQHPRHEILMWCLLFLLHAATKLTCDPEHVVDVILYFAGSFNVQLKSFYHQLKEQNSESKHVKQFQMQRCWILLHRLVVASSGSDERSTLPISVRNGFRFSNLVPSLAWMQKIPAFSLSALPVVRYFGWMAVARNAKQFLREKLFLASDLVQLSSLLSIFSDDLSLVDNIVEQKGRDKQIEELSFIQNINIEDGGRFLGHEDGLQSFHALYPDISKFFPNMKNEFVCFGETILESVGLQLRFLPSSVVPDLMCWFSDLCLWPFAQIENAQLFFQGKHDYFKGFVAKNAKAVILYVLEAILVEHMEAIAPEVPRVVKVLESLCKTSYCDISFLDSVLCLLKPVIAYSINMMSDGENSWTNDSFDSFDSLCFGDLFNNIRYSDYQRDTPVEKGKCQALTIYVLATIFCDLSFHHKIELLQSSILWAQFAEFEGSGFFHDYICAYQILMGNCKDLLFATSRAWGIIPIRSSSHSDTSICGIGEFSKSSSRFLNYICNPSSSTDVSDNHHDENNAVPDASQKFCQLTLEEVKSFSKDLEALILKLIPTLEQCWKLHIALSKKLVLTCSECYLYARSLSLTAEKKSSCSGKDYLVLNESLVELPRLWDTSLQALSEMILMLQETHCWEVASVCLDSLLQVPQCFHLDNVIDDIWSALKNFSTRAPNIFWRLQADKMMSLLFARGIHNICKDEGPLVDLFSALLGHPEPEQRYIALKNLGRLVGQDVDGGRLFFPLKTESITSSSGLLVSSSKQVLSTLVSAIWDIIVLMASSDSSLLLRTNAMALLIYVIPFAEKPKLQAFLAAADSILQCLTTLAQPMCYGRLTQLSLALVASICLYSPSEDLSLIPESVWRNIEAFGLSENDKCCNSLEKKACEALCSVKNDGEQAKELLKGVLSSRSLKQEDPHFATTRESIFQVMSNLTSAKSYFDFFSNEADKKMMELEEAEAEIELLQGEGLIPDSSFDFQDWQTTPLVSTYAKDDNRLQQIKDGIRSIEKAQLREAVAARRQQKLLLRHARQQFLEEAALREAKLIEKVDRERASEAEKELERQHLMELERAKTRELRHNLEIEKEKLAQRDLQRELEQVEFGVRPSRREFASSSHSRTRDRYHRENSRETNDGTSKTGAAHTLPPDNTISAGVFSGRAPFSGPPPTILQARERPDEYGSSYEENFDGSGDTGSVGDPETVSTLEGQVVGYGSGQRHGSRGGKSRPVGDRRERVDSRREGKWERKH